jgi:hypothetical protein
MRCKTTYYIKGVRLVPPAVAQRLGLPAEAPTFLSPAINGPQRCGDCGTTYTPLVYQVGHETRAQHFHPNRGGIYFYGITVPDFYVLHATTTLSIVSIHDGEVICTSPITTHLEPIGPFTPYDYDSHEGACQYGRAEEVRTKEIAVYCADATCANATTPLTEGLLVEYHWSAPLRPDHYARGLLIAPLANAASNSMGGR